MNIYKTVCILLAAMLCKSVSAQNSATPYLNNLTEKFIKYVNSDSHEKILLETDRKIYAAGEKIWFKAFLLHKPTGIIDTASKNLFVDLVTENDSVMEKLVLNVPSFNTHGAISLKNTLKTGTYWLRSYTKKMLVEDANSIYVEPIFIYNLKDKSVDSKQVSDVQNTEPVVSFFPERLTNTGVKSSMVIKIMQGSKPVMASGEILDSHDSVITKFTTNKIGLAKVLFAVTPIEKYKAAIQGKDGLLQYPLPAYNPAVAQISVIGKSGNTLAVLITQEDSVYTDSSQTYIIGISHNKLCYAGAGRGSFKATIPLDDFPGGIADLILFGSHENVLCERKIYVYKNNYTVNIKTDKDSYTPRQNVHTAIEVTNALGKPEVASLNISVQDNRILNISDELQADTLLSASTDIENWLLRYADIFTANDIDMLMVAQPPTYLNWKTNATLNTSYADDNTPFTWLHGKIQNRRSVPVKGEIVTELAHYEGGVFLDTDTTDASGNFKVQIPINKDSLLVQLQVSDKSGDATTEKQIVVDTVLFPVFSTPAILKAAFTDFATTLTTNWQSYHIDTVFTDVDKEWLNPITVHSVQKKQLPYDESKRMSMISKIISSDMIPEGGYGTITNTVLMTAGLSIKGGYLVFFGGSGIGASAADEPLVILDGVPIPVEVMGTGLAGSSPVMEFLNSFNPRDIDFIEVLRGADAAIFGARSGNGAIIINTKSGTGNYSNSKSSLKFVVPVTYHVSPKFIMPNYADNTVKNSKAPDERVTLYWNGNIITDTKGKASFDFYTADTATDYAIVISGITANGDCVYKRVSLQMK